jgi:hypothetical protein
MEILRSLGFVESEWEMKKEAILMGFEPGTRVISDIISDISNDVSRGGNSWASFQAILSKIISPFQTFFASFFDPFIFQTHTPLFMNFLIVFFLTVEGQADFYPP